jgi:hypothetical protein
MDPERDPVSVETTGDDLASYMAEVAAGVESITGGLGALTAKMAELQAALQRRLEALGQREALIASRQSDLDKRDQELNETKAQLESVRGELEGGRGDLEAMQKELEQVQSELATRAAELEARAAELTSEEERLATREEAVRKFQTTMAGVMQAFAVPGSTALNVDSPRASRRSAVSAVPDPEPGDPPDAAEPNPPPPEPDKLDEQSSVSPEPSQPEIQAAAPLLEDDSHAAPTELHDAESNGSDANVVECSETPPEPPDEPPRAHANEPAPSTKHHAPASGPEGDGTVAEADLDDDTRQKLKVLRRLTGGRVSDKELLARIAGEPDGAPAGASGAGKSKKRWWSG